MDKTMKALILSDTIVQPISTFLANQEFPTIIPSFAPYNQIRQTIMENSEVSQGQYDILILWATPERLFPEINNLLDNFEIDIEKLMIDCDNFLDQLSSFASKFNHVFIFSWSISKNQRWLHSLRFKNNYGISNILMQLNLKLSKFFTEHTGTVIIDTDYTYQALASEVFNPKLYFIAKVNYTLEYFEFISSEIKALMRSQLGHRKKLIIVDLDNTLWGGIIGDDGIDNIQLNENNPIGESFVALQKVLKRLKKSGVLLAICSKNTESIAMQVIETHPSMVLRKEDFVAWRLNWKDKASNIVEIANELNINLNSIVFIDDSESERDRVKSALPEVIVPDLPNNFHEYSEFVENLNFFEINSITVEDHFKTKMYLEERERHKEKKKLPSLLEWLSSLDLIVKEISYTPRLLERIIQLMNKTNQFNMTGKKLSEDEWKAIIKEPSCKTFIFSVSDKFGDYGITAIVMVDEKKISMNEIRITEFVMSCRVMGKEIENSILDYVVNYYKIGEISTFLAKYDQTGKNQPFIQFIKEKYMNENDGYKIDDMKVKKPEFIKVVSESSALV